MSFFLFFLGLIVGSFLNVVIFRYDPEKKLFNLKSLSGRSHCPACGQTLRWYELIPLLSFLIQKGKCRTCGTKISWQYPLVELISGLIFLLPLYLITNYQLPITQLLNYQLLISSIIWILAFLIFLIITVIDYRLYLIPDELNIGLAVLGIARIFSGGESFLGRYSILFGLRENIWLNHLAAAFFGILLVGLIILVSRGKGMGVGDLKLIAALGFLYGWPDILMIFILGSFIGAAASLLLIALKKKTMKSIVPFGPFLVLGAVLVFFFGETLLREYFNLFGLL